MSESETNPEGLNPREPGVEADDSGAGAAADFADDEGEQRPLADSLHEQPFEELAVSLSGGGYRAAAFHLGVLDMLQRLGLLPSVRVLSTVSGGTFTGLKYALSVAKQQPYEKFYRDCHHFLADTNVIEGALGKLHEGECSPFAGQMPSLIRAAARVYSAPEMFGEETFDVLMKDQTSHLKEMSFNATEFRTANYFRFQRSKSAGAVVGNGNLRVKKLVAPMIRLADIAAASSCFPSAFEPMRFPDDFLWPHGLERVRESLGKNFKDCVPLMDGGVYDNQGVDSILRTYKREGNKVGLVIISDTNQRAARSGAEKQEAASDNRRLKLSIFEFKPEKRRGRLTLGMIVKLAWAFFLLLVVNALVLLVAGLQSAFTVGLRPFDAFLYVVPFLLTSLLAAALVWAHGRVREGQERAAEVTKIELWPHLKRLTVPELFELINGRVKSLIALTASIFMSRVRALVYQNIKVYEKYTDRHVENLIYDLANKSRFDDDVLARLAPTEALSDVALAAEDVATALWLKGPQDLRNLVACGQATTCFNILHYLLSTRAAQLDVPGSRESEIFALAGRLWQKLSVDPYELYDEAEKISAT